MSAAGPARHQILETFASHPRMKTQNSISDLHSIQHHHFANPPTVHHRHVLFVFSVLVSPKKPPFPLSPFWCLWSEEHKASRSHPPVVCCPCSATWLMCPLSCGCPQNVARTQCSLQRHMIDVCTVLRLSTECGRNTTKLKHLENVSVWSDVFVWTVASLCFCSAFVLFCFCSVLFCFPFCFVYISVFPVYVVFCFCFFFGFVLFLLCFCSVLSHFFWFSFVLFCSCYIYLSVLLYFCFVSVSGLLLFWFSFFVSVLFLFLFSFILFLFCFSFRSLLYLFCICFCFASVLVFFLFFLFLFCFVFISFFFLFVSVLFLLCSRFVSDSPVWTPPRSLRGHTASWLLGAPEFCLWEQGGQGVISGPSRSQVKNEWS